MSSFVPISEDFLGNPLEFENGLGQGFDDFTLDELVALLKSGFIDIVQGLAKPTVAQVDAPGGVASLLSLPYENLQALTRALASSTDLLQVLQASAGDPLESLRLLALTSGDPLDLLARSATAKAEAVEALQTLYSVNTAIPQAPVLDDFNRADSALNATGNWGISQNSGNTLFIVSNQVKNTTDTFGLKGNKWLPSTFGPDCEIFCTVVTPPTGSDEIMFTVRSPAYRCLWRAGSVAFVSPNDSILPIASAGITLSAGDVIVFRVVGQTLTAYQNGVLVLSFTKTTGTLSTGADVIQVDIRNTVAIIDNFGGGNVSLTYAGVRAIDAIEALAGRSASAQDPGEATQLIKANEVGPLESTSVTSVSQTSNLPLESLHALAVAGSASAYEALQAVDAAGAANALETLRMLAIVGLAEPYEALKKLAVTSSAALSTLLKLAVAGSGEAVEALQTVVITTAEAVEILSTLSRPSQTPQESLSTLAASSVSQLDSLRGLAALIAMCEEALQGVTRAGTGSLDLPAQIATSATSANEALGIIAQTGESSAETLQIVQRTYVAIAEALRGIASSTGVSVETLQAFVAALVAPSDSIRTLAILEELVAESGAELASSVTSQAESLGSIVASSQLAVEALQLVQQFFGDPFDTQNQNAVSNIATFPVETLLGLALMGSVGVESEQAIQVVQQYPADVLRGVAALFAPPYETLLSLSSVGSAMLDSLKRLAASGQLDGESLASVSATAVEVVQALAGTRATIVAPIGALQEIRATIGAPEESRTTGTVSQTAEMALESLQLVERTMEGSLDVGRGIRATTAALYEALRAFNVAGTARAEAVRPVSQNASMIADLKQALRSAGGSAPVEALTGLGGRILGSVEALASLQLLAALRAEAQASSLRVMALMQADALQKVAQTTREPWEFFVFEREGVVLLVDAATAQALLTDEAVALALLDSNMTAAAALTDEIANWLGLTDEATGSVVLSDGED